MENKKLYDHEITDEYIIKIDEDYTLYYFTYELWECQSVGDPIQYEPVNLKLYKIEPL